MDNMLSEHVMALHAGRNKWVLAVSYAGIEINTGPLARGQLISCWAFRICFALAQLASKILKPYFWVYLV